MTGIVAEKMESILNRCSYHAVYDDSILDALAYAHQNSFAGIQLAVECPHLSFENISNSECRQISDFCVQNNLRITIHAPDNSVSLLETNRSLREGTYHYFEQLFTFADRIGSSLITIHPGKVSTFGTDTDPRIKIPAQDLPFYQKAFTENLQRLLTLNHGRRMLCLENFGMTDMVCQTIQPRLDSGDLYLCWDLAKSTPEVDIFFWKNIDYIRQVHLHDTADGISHRAVCTGTLDLMHYLPRLADANIVDFCHEVRPREKALESLKQLKKITVNTSKGIST